VQSKSPRAFAAAFIAITLTGCAGWHPHGNWVPRVDTNAQGFDRPTFDRDVVACQPEATAALEADWRRSMVQGAVFGVVGGGISGAMGGSVTGGIVGGAVGSTVIGHQEMDRMGLSAANERAMAVCLTRKGYRVTGSGRR
jgi:hypothetical protein